MSLRWWMKTLFSRHTTADANFLIDRDIRDWPRLLIVDRCDPILEIGKGYGDDAQQELQVILFSTGYTRFLYANQEDWLSGELKLPRWRRLKSSRRPSSLATAIYTVAFDVAALEQDMPDIGVLCMSDAYRFPEKLLSMPANFLGPGRFQGFLRFLAENVHDPEWMLSAFRPKGFMAQNFAAEDSLYHTIYQALRTGRDPAAVLACLSDSDLPEIRRDVEEFVRRAHARITAC
jgi:hypothetical protein